jgi:glycine cleavage system regulatory protein
MQRSMLVLSVVGADRTGLVQSIAETISAVGGNWEESRMARLAGQFAGILLVTVDPARADELVGRLRKLEANGLVVTVRPTEAPAQTAATVNVMLTLTANDRPGIVRDVSKILAERGCNVEELETRSHPRPETGAPLFSMDLLMTVPSGVPVKKVRTELETLCDELNCDVELAPANLNK